MTQVVQSTQIIAPYGGELVNLLINEDDYQEQKAYASTLASHQLSEREICDLEMLSVGSFSPLKSFMNKADFDSVVNDMRLADGTLFPMPITMSIDNKESVTLGQAIALRDRRNNLLAILTVEDIYSWDLEDTALKVFGTTDTKHPIVAEMHKWGQFNVSGSLKVLQLPSHSDFRYLRMTPQQTRSKLIEAGHENVVAFQTRNPMHRVHEELTKRATQAIDGVLLLHPVVGMTKPGDVDHYTRVRVYKALTETYYESDRIVLSLLPLAMRMGGPREALWHAIIRRNYGANHFIVGRDHAGPGNDSNGKPIYGPYEAQELVIQYEDEIGVKMVPFKMLMYLPDENRYEEVDQIKDGTKTQSISGTQVREDYLAKGIPLPEWFSRPETAKILGESFPAGRNRGVCIWFTGLSGAGKSTIASELVSLLMEHGRQATVLDGDVVRTHLSKGLGFSKDDRDTNIRRIGFVASEIARHGGLVICAAISPYISTRNAVRNLVGDDFVEVFINTSLEVCEERDVKGLYAQARSGKIKGFTGIDDPYEMPVNPEIDLKTVGSMPIENAEKIVQYLKEHNYI